MARNGSARFNIQLEGTPIEMEVLAGQWQSLLSDAAINGCADDFEVFYSSDRGVFGVNVSYEDNDSMGLLEAGAVLGFCLAHYMTSDLVSARQSWMSLHDKSDRTIESPV